MKDRAPAPALRGLSMKGLFISEIFSSVQGEGPYTGEKMVFVRLAGCPLRCRYCDTPASLTVKGHPRLSVDEIVKKLSPFRDITTVSVTGGEPLLQAAGLKDLLPALKKKGKKIYLETAGLHSDGLKMIVDYCDVISMDMKLPSATGLDLWAKHQAFLKIGLEKIFVKVIVDNKSKLSEIKKVVSLLKVCSPPPLLVLQPVTEILPSVQSASVEFLSDAYHWAVNYLPRVLVMPQQHKLWRVP